MSDGALGTRRPLETPQNASERRVTVAIKAVTSVAMRFAPRTRKDPAFIDRSARRVVAPTGHDTFGSRNSADLSESRSLNPWRVWLRALPWARIRAGTHAGDRAHRSIPLWTRPGSAQRQSEPQVPVLTSHVCAELHRHEPCSRMGLARVIPRRVPHGNGRQDLEEVLARRPVPGPPPGRQFRPAPRVPSPPPPWPPIRAERVGPRRPPAPWGSGGHDRTGMPNARGHHYRSGIRNGRVGPREAGAWPHSPPRSGPRPAQCAG